MREVKKVLSETGYKGYVVPESLSAVLPAVVWEVESVSNEPGHLAEAVFHREY